MPPTVLTGDLGTDTINQVQRVPDIDPKVEELEPNVAPLVTLTKKLRKVPAIAPKVQWFEHEPMPRFDVLSASAASNAATLPITNGNYFRVGDVIRNSTNGTAWEVTSTAAGNIGVSGPLGSAGAAVHASGSEIFIVGNVNSEAAGLREIKTAKLDDKYNYCEIVRTPYGITGTEAATKMYPGPDRTRLKADGALEHLRTWEQIALVGARSENLTTPGKPKRTAGGFTDFVTTNITPAGGTLTEATFQTFLRSGYRYSSGGGRKLLLAAPLVVSAIEGFARANIQVVNDDAGTYGVKMKTYRSGQGDVDIVMERWMNDSIVYRGYAFLIDLDSIQYMPLRDTKLLEDRQAPDIDAIRDEWFTEATFAWKHERRHALLTGVTG